MKYIYFVSFQANKGKETGFGSVEVLRNVGITTIEEIREIEKDIIKENELDSVVILNFQLLRTE